MNFLELMWGLLVTCLLTVAVATVVTAQSSAGVASDQAWSLIRLPLLGVGGAIFVAGLVPYTWRVLRQRPVSGTGQLVVSLLLGGLIVLDATWWVPWEPPRSVNFWWGQGAFALSVAALALIFTRRSPTS